MNTLSLAPAPDDHVLGSLQSAIIIVEYGDYDCPHTRAAHSVLKQLLAENEGQVALVFRHFPLRHMHENAQQLAELMEAIEDQDRYWTAHERLMGVRRLTLQLALERLTELGHDPAELEQRAQAARERVERDVQRGKVDGVHSTPSFFFNGAPHDGHYDLDTLREQLGKAR
jgi:protein-disulfide isomerase